VAATKSAPSSAKIDIRGWLTRNQVADLLSCAVASVITYERKGLLHPQRELRTDGRVMRQMIVIDPAEVARLPRKKLFVVASNPDELCSRAFEMFDDGKSVREIVIELRAHKEKIDALKQEWLDAGGCDLIVTPAIKEQLERHVGMFSTVGELADRVAETLTRARVGGEVIVATVPADASDAAIEGAINAALDRAGAP